MSSCTLIALARPTFDVAAAEKFYGQARELLSELGATINGPKSLSYDSRRHGKCRGKSKSR